MATMGEYDDITILLKEIQDIRHKILPERYDNIRDQLEDILDYINQAIEGSGN